MSQLSHLNHLILRVYDLAHQASMDEFSQHILKELRTAIQFDSAALYSLTVKVNEPVRLNACLSESDSREKLVYRFKTVTNERLDPQGRVQSRDRLVQTAFNRPGRSFYADLDSIGDKQLLAYAQRFSTRHAYLHAARLGANIGAVSLWRAQQPNRFSLRDAVVGNLLLPHVFKAVQINRKIASVAHPENGEQAWQIVFDEHGCILFSDEGAGQLINQEWRQWNPPYVPMVLLHEIQRQGFFQGKHLRAQRLPSTQLYVIRLHPVASGHRLTPTEITVARLAAQSLSYKEVAREMGTSPATVRNQLHSIYGKLNITGKAALAHALHRH